MASSASSKLYSGGEAPPPSVFHHFSLLYLYLPVLSSRLLSSLFSNPNFLIEQTMSVWWWSSWTWILSSGPVSMRTPARANPLAPCLFPNSSVTSAPDASCLMNPVRRSRSLWTSSHRSALLIVVRCCRSWARFCSSTRSTRLLSSPRVSSRAAISMTPGAVAAGSVFQIFAPDFCRGWRISWRGTGSSAGTGSGRLLLPPHCYPGPSRLLFAVSAPGFTELWSLISPLGPRFFEILRVLNPWSQTSKECFALE